MCSSIFSSIASAKNHLRFALLRGYCPADRALLQIEVAPCFDVCCPICEKVCADHSAYHWHVRSHFPHLQHSIEILDSSGLTFPARVIAAGDGTRLEAKSRRATTEGPSSGENVKGGRRDKKASGYTGQVIIVQRAAAAGSEEHSAGGAPSSDGQPGGHESHEGVRRGRQGNVSQGQRRTASLTSMCGTLYWASQCEAWKIDRRPIRILRFSFRVR